MLFIGQVPEALVLVGKQTLLAHNLIVLYDKPVEMRTAQGCHE